MTNDVRSPLVYRIAFASLQGMGVDLARKLLDVVGSEQRFFEMSEKDLRALTRGRSKIYRDDYRRDCLLRAASEEAFIREHGISATYYTDEAYPHRLIEAPDAPAMFYSLGQCDLESAHVISVVGTRHATQYGSRFCDTTRSGNWPHACPIWSWSAVWPTASTLRHTARPSSTGSLR